MADSLGPTTMQTPASVIAGLRGGLCELGTTLWPAKTPSEQVEAIVALEKIRSVLDAVVLTLAVEVEASNAAASEGWRTAGAFLTAVSGGFEGSGAATVKLGRALASDREATGQALAQARISRAQAEVIVTALDKLPRKASLREAGEQALLELARTHNATELRAAAKQVLAAIDPDGDEKREEAKLAREERAAHLRRFLSITEDDMGGVRLKGRGTVEDAAWIKAALFPLMKPITRDPGACGGTPTRNPLTHQHSDDCADGDGGACGLGSATGSCGIPGCAHDGRDPREHGTRMWDALTEACRKLLDHPDTPTSHGVIPRVALTMDYWQLLNLTGPATLETGQTLSASAVRKLACDAEILPIVLGSHSEVLDVGRTQRLVTTAIWKALVARDGHCRFPGCHLPPIACDAHHIQHWIDGGATSLDNLVLLCRAHHTMIHTTPWHITMNPADRRPDFIPPARLDPEQTPIRVRHPRE